MRIDKRKNDEIRPIRIIKDFMPNASGSCLIECGRTRVLATASVEEGVPPFREASGLGWLTAEYSMLPGATPVRKKRERGKSDSRSIEIQRLIGRALRSVMNFADMPGITIHIDCDVIQADGGTRTASITGAFVALKMCIEKLLVEGKLIHSPIRGYLAAISAGIVEEEPRLDLCYVEDSSAAADMNVVADEEGGIAEIQLSGEQRTIEEAEFVKLLALCKKGIRELIEIQKKSLGEEK